MKSIIIAFWLCFGWAAAEAAFMIVSGTYWDYANKENKTSILKIDTETGKTWRYVDSIVMAKGDDGNTHSMVNFGWEEVPERSVLKLDGVPVIPGTNVPTRSR